MLLVELVEEVAGGLYRQLGGECGQVLVAGHEYGSFLLCECDQVVVARIGRSARRLGRISGQNRSVTQDRDEPGRPSVETRVRSFG